MPEVLFPVIRREEGKITMSLARASRGLATTLLAKMGGRRSGRMGKGDPSTRVPDPVFRLPSTISSTHTLPILSEGLETLQDPGCRDRGHGHDGRNARDRLRVGWIDGVRRALNDRRMDVREASEHARYRNEWGTIVTQF